MCNCNTSTIDRRALQCALREAQAAAARACEAARMAECAAEKAAGLARAAEEAACRAENAAAAAQEAAACAEAAAEKVRCMIDDVFNTRDGDYCPTRYNTGRSTHNDNDCDCDHC